VEIGQNNNLFPFSNSFGDSNDMILFRDASDSTKRLEIVLPESSFEFFNSTQGNQMLPNKENETSKMEVLPDISDSFPCIFQENVIELSENPHDDNLEENDLKMTMEDITVKKKAGRKMKFTPEEDERLLSLINLHGKAKWSLIADLMPGRNRKQLREHYINYLKKESNKNGFTTEEDVKLLQLVETNGTSWSKIAELMPGRAPQALKNRYYSRLKKGKKSQTTCSLIPHVSSSAALSKERNTSSNSTMQTSERTSLTISERASADIEQTKKKPAQKNKKELVNILKKQKDELQNILETAAQKIQSMDM
jgi:hypothetical protein